ncbi:hypothetical protein QT327_28005 [Olivibacter sp. 47]|nr:hypothetical protein [Olivibacter sp. 47]
MLEHFGIATDSCWLFRVNHGRLKAYSFLSERVGLDSFYLTAFQVEDGPIQAFDIKELEKIIADHPKAMKAFRKKDYYKAILTFNR